MSTNRKRLVIAFYRGGQNEPLINNITKYITGKYIHCELVFDFNNGENLACGVWQNENVFFRHKTFGRTEWDFRSIYVTENQYNTIKQFCMKQSKMKKPFNTSGLYRCITPWPKTSDGKSWFCSELVVSAFQSADMFNELYSGSTSPSILYEYVSKKSFKDSSPVVNSRINKAPLKFMQKSKPKHFI